MPWKDGFFKRNPTLRRIALGASVIIAVVVLALVFGPDETREFARDVAEKLGFVGAEIVPEPSPAVKP